MDPARLQRVLRQALVTEQLLGIDAVPVRRTNEDLARIAGAAVAVHADTPGHGGVAGGVGPAVGAASVSVAGSRQPVAAAALTPPRPPARAPAEPEALADEPTVPGFSVGHEVRVVDSLFAPSDRPRLNLEEKLRVLSDLDQNHVKPCTRCGLCKGRIQTVFGEGDADARLMFVGEGPGQTEDEEGRPFVGRAGELLNNMIVAMGLKREQVYIANVVKCRPPDNRPPTPIEAEACWPYLRSQIEALQPRVIVTLGGSATKFLLRTERGITSIRGTWHTLKHAGPGGQDIVVMPTFHPAYLLRAYTPDNRKKVWADLRKVMAYLSGAS